jgi:hypothetical protein
MLLMGMKRNVVLILKPRHAPTDILMLGRYVDPNKG